MACLSSLLHPFSIILLLSLFLTTSPCSKADAVTVLEEANQYHVVTLQSLLPTDVCTPSKEIEISSLEVVHRHGPCSPLKHKKKPTHIHIHILNHDHLRVDWLHNKKSSAASSLRTKKSHGSSSLSASKIPARAGSSFGTGNFVVTIGVGTPKVTQSVIFDTGSDVTWIQCQPCVSVCYSQQDPLFDPTQSSSYKNISCNSPYCSSLDTSGCSGSTCLYAVQYGDNSYTVGFFAQDTLTLTPSDVIPNFLFGCGEKNNGLFGMTAGLIGLGRKQVSLVSQTVPKYGGAFSYCLPSTSSSTGYLTLGKTTASNIQFTPMLSDSTMPTFYFVELTSISVAGQRLAISPTLFSNAGVLVDSGTVITRLPPTAYTALKSAFKQKMAKYPSAPAASILDTCYDLSKYQTVEIPSVALNFKGASVSLDPSGIVYMASLTQACLAFAPNGDDTDLVIVGNTQQRRFNVVYDVSKKVVGFGPEGC